MISKIITKSAVICYHNRQEMIMYNSDSKRRGHAIALYSGGLDSALAILLILRQNIEVTALTFLTNFGCGIEDKSSCGSDPYPAAEKFGFRVKLVHLGEKFINMVKSPSHGYGKNMNPCIDCRILMLREAHEFMKMVNADFIITGEVLGQRPMSQMRNTLRVVERDSGLDGYLVRPLSAKLLKETIPEGNGILDRNLLEDISGRSRKRQMALAKEFGLDDYPNSAAGCLLTDKGYSNRLRDLIKHVDDFGFDDLNLLRIGRHFRLTPKAKLIVGRDEDDNNKIEQLAKPNQMLLEALGTGSPVAILIGEADEKTLRMAAAITARYCDLKHQSMVEIACTGLDDNKKISVRPFEALESDKYIIR
jgi:tRNA U34 2-thiouridine synthase MnmA/TrmU